MLLEYLAFAQCSVAYVPAGCPSPGPRWAPPGPRGAGGPRGRPPSPWHRCSCGCSAAGVEQNIPSTRSPGDLRGEPVPARGCHISPDPVSPRATRYDKDSAENGSPGSDKGRGPSLEDLNKSTSSSPTQGSSKVRHLTVR